jgi:hypothetical protein
MRERPASDRSKMCVGERATQDLEVGDRNQGVASRLLDMEMWRVVIVMILADTQ